ncbi:hypothetical protein SAMN05216464_104220 [Mucilaginibacter pineti]|uniref:Uncharacterized protein n=1 Tax=Mucilaginibacter pineti TaxID=1391627 RepID=A0A1G7AQY4_9SPHI|nr:hypothetical protein SAMN05216464_104220 [Mucilaginibacter pineti]
MYLLFFNDFGCQYIIKNVNCKDLYRFFHGLLKLIIYFVSSRQRASVGRQSSSVGCHAPSAGFEEAFWRWVGRSTIKNAKRFHLQQILIRFEFFVDVASINFLSEINVASR